MLLCERGGLGKKAWSKSKALGGEGKFPNDSGIARSENCTLRDEFDREVVFDFIFRFPVFSSAFGVSSDKQELKNKKMKKSNMRHCLSAWPGHR